MELMLEKQAKYVCFKRGGGIDIPEVAVSCGQKRMKPSLCCQRADMDRLQAYTKSNLEMEKKIEIMM